MSSGRGDWWRLVLAFAAIYGIWGSTYLAIGYAVDTVPPLMMVGIRSLVAGLVLFGWSLARGAPWPAAATWREPLVAGALLFLGGQGMLAWAEQYIPTGPAAVLNGTIPLFVLLLEWKGGWLMGRANGQRPDALRALGIVLGLAGVTLLVGPLGGDIPVWSALMVTAGSFAWALGTFHAGSAAKTQWPAQRAGQQLLAAGLLLFVVSALTGELSRVQLSAITLRSVAALAYLIVFGSLVAYSAFVWLLGRIEPSRVSSHAYVNPAVALLLGWWIGGEELSVRSIVASVMIVGSVALIISKAEESRAARVTRAPVPVAKGGIVQRRLRTRVHARRRRSLVT